MAGGQERILRGRIRSVQATKKITRAMELISATRVVKAQERAAAARPYSEQITSVILDLVQAGAAKDHPLASKLFDIPGVSSLLLLGDFVAARGRATSARPAHAARCGAGADRCAARP